MTMTATIADEVRREVAARAEASMRRFDERVGVRHAEIVPGTTPHWHVLVTAPAHELIAAGHLAARGFGVFVPDVESKTIRKGRPMVVRQRMFPGYLFVFVWDIDRHWRRIRACAGVVGVVSAAGSQRPVCMPDHMIEDILAADLRSWVRANVPAGRKGSAAFDQVMPVQCKSRWGGVAKLAPQERIGLLHKALGLALQSPPMADASAGGP